jgi:dTDP-4-dehydrorhamnose 3,5-epimerase
MRFTPTSVEDVHLVDVDRITDERGFFARAWCTREFEQQGLNGRIAQANIGFSERRGTLRGMHFQLPPHAEAKLVRCTRGVVYDVAVDLRPDSTTYLRWFGVQLSADNARMLYVPPGCAHGYLTLTDGTELFYQTSEFYEPAAARGVRYDDPAFGIDWPTEVRVISEQDRNWPLVAQDGGKGTQ